MGNVHTDDEWIIIGHSGFLKNLQKGFRTRLNWLTLAGSLSVDFSVVGHGNLLYRTIMIVPQIRIHHHVAMLVDRPR